MLKKLFILSILIGHIFIAFGTDLKFYHLSASNGLSNNEVFSIIKDSKGFMWFGTTDGLNMYDGYDFKIFTNMPGDNLSITGNSIFCLFEDRKTNLWIATNNGVDVFNRNDNSFRHIPYIKNDGKKYFNNYFQKIVEDKLGNIFVTSAEEIYVFDTVKNVLVPFKFKNHEDNILLKIGIEQILFDKDNKLWITSKINDVGLFVYDMAKKRLVSDPYEKRNFSFNKKPNCIQQHANQDIWIGTDNGIYVVRPDISGFKKLDKIKEPVFSIIFQNENTVWIGTRTAGLFCYKINENIVEQYENNEADQDVFTVNNADRLYLDNRDILWFTTLPKGINYTSLKNYKPIFLLKNIPGNQNSLINNNISSIIDDYEGNLWIGSFEGGVDKLNLRTGQFNHFQHNPKNPASLSNDAVASLTRDRLGNIWVGGYQAGVNLINKETGYIENFRHKSDDPNSITSDDVNCLLADKKNNIWIATNGGGLNRYNLYTKKFTPYKTSDNKNLTNTITNDYVISLMEDSYGKLWIGTYYGICVFNTETQIFKNYNKNDSIGGLSSDWIYCFAEDSAKNIWVGTALGLNYFDRKTGHFTTWYKKNGLPSDVIKGILIDKKSNLWISTNNGLSKFDPRTGIFKNLNASDGLQGGQFNIGACCAEHSGKLYFGGLSGLNYFYPDSIKDNPIAPPVYITDLLLFFSKINIDQKNGPLFKSIIESNSLELSYKQSVITFRYTALNFINAEKTLYAYMLVGFDKDWIAVGNRREATYTNLNPGTYIFRVKACNNDGIWNEQGASINITILPPWWRATWFRIIVFFAFILSIYLAYYLRVEMYRKKEKELTVIVRQRTREISQANDILLERQARIEEYAEEMRTHTEHLTETNYLLIENQKLTEKQAKELKVKNEQLSILNSTKDRFFSIIAHDLRNPFHTVSGFAEVLIKDYKKLPAEKLERYLNLIYASSTSGNNLLENLLQWSRTQTGNISYTPTKINLSAIVEETMNLLEGNARSKNITVQSLIDQNITVFADENMLKTIFRNLISNATKFTPENGSITINYALSGSQVEVTVADTGIGIPPENLSKLFRIDTNVSTKGTANETGTGLGLILCKEFVEKHNGKIWVESENGKGSKFKFTLPMS